MESLPEKRCTACGEKKPLTAFGQDKQRKDGRNGRCLLCRRPINSAATKKHLSDLTNKAKRKVYQDNYNTLHKQEKDAYSAAYRKDRKKMRVIEGRYRQRYPAKVQLKQAKRRSSRRVAHGNDLTSSQWLEIQTAQHHRCYYCGKRRKGKLTPDHLTPLAQNGLLTLHNVIAVCGPCNSGKRDRKPPVPVQPFLLTVAPGAIVNVS